MTLYATLTREIDESPRGARSIAFFDFDGTIIFGYSIAAIFFERVMSGALAPSDALCQFLKLVTHGINGTEYSRILREAAQTLTGQPEAAFRQLGDRAFDRHLAGAVYPETRALIRAHLRRGHRVAVISSATPYQIEPIARELGITDVLCNTFHVEDGSFVGTVCDPICYAEGKKIVAEQFAKRHNVDLEDCWFYTDGFEDLPLLMAVSHPRPLNPDDRLKARARREGWPARTFDSRGWPGFRELVRTGLVYGAFFSAALQIIPTWILNRSRREAVNLAVTTWGEFGSALAGIRVRIRGENYLWERRPAVFLFNHQSAIDVLIVAKLLRRDFTAIAKQEIANNPLVAPVFRVADTVFVDRKNHQSAVEALKPVVKTLREGLSVAIAPEGTRSCGVRLGPFKKGPFHIAMQAGVPVVPIIIHNATDVLPKGGFFIRPADVHVDVLPPVSTDSWRPETVAQHAEEIRRQFLRVLGQQEAEAEVVELKRAR